MQASFLRTLDYFCWGDTFYMLKCLITPGRIDSGPGFTAASSRIMSRSYHHHHCYTLNIATYFFSLSSEMKRISVFKNYEAGEPTCRLYVKNIAKQVEEKVGAFVAWNAPLFHDMNLSSVIIRIPHSYFPFLCLKDLKYIYGRYINPSSEEERNMYVNPSCHSPRLRGAAARPVSTRYFWLWRFVPFPLRGFRNSCWPCAAVLLISIEPDADFTGELLGSASAAPPPESSNRTYVQEAALITRGSGSVFKNGIRCKGPRYLLTASKNYLNNKTAAGTRVK